MKKMYDTITEGTQKVSVEVSLDVVAGHPDTVSVVLSLPGICRPAEVNDLGMALSEARSRSELLEKEFRRLYNIPDTTKTFLGPSR